MRNYLKIAILIVVVSCSKGNSYSSGGNNNNPPPPPPPPATQNNNTIVFIKPNPDGGIYTVNDNGGNMMLLKGVSEGDSVAHANWPFGDMIYFCGRLSDDDRLQIYRIKSDGSGLTKIVNDPANEYSQLHVIHNKMVYEKKSSANGGAAIFKNVLDGTDENKIMDVGDFTITAVSLFPMSNQIIIVSDEPVVNGGPKVSNMYAVNDDGSGKTNLTNNSDPLTVFDKPYFCPDGTKFSFIKTLDSSSVGYNVYWASPNFGETFNILQASSKDASWTTGNWSNDLNWILITDGDHKLYKITHDGKTKTALGMTSYQPMFRN